MSAAVAALGAKVPLRPILIVAAALVGAAAAVCAAMYLATVAFLVLSRVSPARATPLGFARSFKSVCTFRNLSGNVRKKAEKATAAICRVMTLAFCRFSTGGRICPLNIRAGWAKW